MLIISPCSFTNRYSIECRLFTSLFAERLIERERKRAICLSRTHLIVLCSTGEKTKGLQLKSNWKHSMCDRWLSHCFRSLFLRLVPPRFVVYSPLEASVSFTEGSAMTLFCRALAVPSANITWIYRDKMKQSKSEHSLVHESNERTNERIMFSLAIHVGEDLSIASVQSSQSGSYECIASNDYHASISRSFYVTVQCKSFVELHDRQNGNGNRNEREKWSESINFESISVRRGSHYTISYSLRWDDIQWGFSFLVCSSYVIRDEKSNDNPRG